MFKVTFQFLFNVLMVFNTVSYFKFNFKLKKDSKMHSFENLEEN